jgi:hypothetical protein
MTAALLLFVCFVLGIQSKILGTRTENNFPTDWEIVGEPCAFGSQVKFIVALKQVCNDQLLNINPY